MLWFPYIILNHRVPCSGVENQLAVPIASQPHQRVRVFVCDWELVIPKCAVEKENPSWFTFLGGGIMVKTHHTVLSNTNKTNSSVSIHTVIKIFIFNITFENVHLTWYRMIRGEKSKEIKACAVYNQTGSTRITAATMDITGNNLKHPRKTRTSA